ncbi:unnamed protein product, partial [Cylindrotheca closterium]
MPHQAQQQYLIIILLKISLGLNIIIAAVYDITNLCHQYQQQIIHQSDEYDILLLQTLLAVGPNDILARHVDGHGSQQQAIAESIAASASKEFNTYHNSAAICVIQKGALRYIDEWVYYNLLGIGFDHIYFYDNSDDFELQ